MKPLLLLALWMSCAALARAQPIDARTTDINTSFAELAPVVSLDGTTLYFVRTGHPRNMGTDNAADIWVVTQADATSWNRVLNAGAPINSGGADRVIGLGPPGQWVAVFRESPVLQIDLLQRRGRYWKITRSLPLPVSLLPDQLGQLHLAIDGRTLIFAADLPGGRGDLDLYVSFLGASGQWSAPLSLGPTINSSASDNAPYLAADGRTLYFASRRAGGKGGSDLWMSRSDGTWQSWTDPVNVSTLNTPDDDDYLALSARDQVAYTVVRTEDNRLNLQTTSLPPEEQPDPVTLVRGRCELPPGVSLAEARLRLQTPQGETPLDISPDSSYCLVVPSGTAASLILDLPGYYAPALRLNGGQTAGVTLDYDPNNALAVANMSAAYFQRENEIDQLRRQLEQTQLSLRTLADARAEQRKMLQSGSWREQALPAEALYRNPEVQALREQYQQTAGDTLPRPDWQPRALPPLSHDEEQQQNLEELEAMKQRWRRYQLDKNLAAAAEERARNETYLWEDSLSFEELRDRARRELEAEILPRVGEELVQETLAASEQRDAIDAQRLQAQIRQSLYSPTSGSGELPGWQEDLQSGLQQAISPILYETYRAQLRPVVTEAVQTEVALRQNELRASELEQQIRAKVLDQIREEEKQGASARIDAPAPVAEKPLLAYSEQQQSLRVARPQPGTTLTLEAVAFAPNGTQLIAGARAELDRLVSLLRARPELRLEVGGHTNGWLNHATAMRLSAQRAKVMADYLTQAGIARDRVTYKGYGKTRPIADNNTLEGRARNQRMEVRFLE